MGGTTHSKFTYLHEWTEKKRLSTYFSKMSEIVKISGTKFAVATQNGGLYAYKTRSDDWKNYPFPSSILCPSIASIGDEKIIVVGPSDMVFIIDSKGPYWFARHIEERKTTLPVGPITAQRKIYSFEDIDERCKIHVIGGFQCKDHLIYDMESNQTSFVHSFDEFKDGFIDFSVTLSQTGDLILSGGNQPFIGYPQKSRKIHIFNKNSRNWRNAKYPLPRGMNEHSTLIIDNTLIIFCGANIDLFDMKTGKTSLSVIKCPIPTDYNGKNQYRAIAMRYIESELAVAAYVKDCERELNMAIPICFRGLICRKTEFINIHVIHRNLGFHWAINVDKLFIVSP